MHLARSRSEVDGAETWKLSESLGEIGADPQGTLGSNAAAKEQGWGQVRGRDRQKEEGGGERGQGGEGEGKRRGRWGERGRGMGFPKT